MLKNQKIGEKKLKSKKVYFFIQIIFFRIKKILG